MTECSECPGLFSLFLPLLDDFSLSEHYSRLYLYLLDKSRQHVPVNKRVSLKDTLLGSLRNTSGTKGVGPTGNQQSWSHRSKETIPSLVRKTGISQCAIPTAGKKCPGQNCECDSRGTLISPSGHCPPWRAAQSRDGQPWWGCFPTTDLPGQCLFLLFSWAYAEPFSQKS